MLIHSEKHRLHFYCKCTSVRNVSGRALMLRGQFILQLKTVSVFWRDLPNRSLFAEVMSNTTQRLVTQRWTQSRTPFMFTSHPVTWGDMWRSLTFTCRKYVSGWNCKVCRLFWVTGSLFLEIDTGVYNIKCIFYTLNTTSQMPPGSTSLYNNNLRATSTEKQNKTNRHKTGWTNSTTRRSETV